MRLTPGLRQGITIASLILGSSVAGPITSAENDTPWPSKAERLRFLDARNASGDFSSSALERVLGARWGVKDQPSVRRSVQRAFSLRPDGAWLDSGPILIYVERSDNVPEEVVAYLTERLPLADADEKTVLYKVARRLGTRAAALAPVIKRDLSSTMCPLAISAASAISTIDPDDATWEPALLQHLASPELGERWRAADAVGYAPALTERLAARLAELARHRDVRIRVAAAAALSRHSKDLDPNLRTLRGGLREEDLPMPMGFSYPSNIGASHRAYIATEMGRLRRNGHDVLNDLVWLADDASSKCETIGDPHGTVMFKTLDAIADSGPTPKAVYQQLEQSLLADEDRDNDWVKVFLGEISVASE